MINTSVYKQLFFLLFPLTSCSGNCVPEWQPPWPWQCPPVPSGTVGTCIDACGSAGCPPGLMCCSNGCGLECKVPVAGPNPVNPSPTQCPEVPAGQVGNCLDGCSNGCPYPQICCSNGCGSFCWGFPSFPLPATSQCPSIEPGTVGACVEICDGQDYFGNGGCPEGEVCCSNGCGHVCMSTVKVCPDYGPPVVQCTVSPCASMTCLAGSICCDDYSSGCDAHCI